MVLEATNLLVLIKHKESEFRGTWFSLFGKFLNNRLVDHLEKYGLFLHLEVSFSTFLSTAESNRIASVFNRCRATRAVAVNISEVFD